MPRDAAIKLISDIENALEEFKAAYGLPSNTGEEEEADKMPMPSPKMRGRRRMHPKMSQSMPTEEE